jgi:hypothetical protein
MMTRNMLQVVFSLVMFALAPTLAQTAPATPCDPKVEQANLTVFQSYLKDLTTLMGQFDRTLYWSTDATLDIPAALPPTLYASCDKVFLQGSWDATATATGKKVSQPILEVFTFEDGKIINDTFFFFDVQEIVKVLEP